MSAGRSVGSRHVARRNKVDVGNRRYGVAEMTRLTEHALSAAAIVTSLLVVTAALPF